MSGLPQGWVDQSVRLCEDVGEGPGEVFANQKRLDKKKKKMAKASKRKNR